MKTLSDQLSVNESNTCNTWANVSIASYKNYIHKTQAKKLELWH